MRNLTLRNLTGVDLPEFRHVFTVPERQHGSLAAGILSLMDANVRKKSLP